MASYSGVPLVSDHLDNKKTGTSAATWSTRNQNCGTMKRASNGAGPGRTRPSGTQRCIVRNTVDDERNQTYDN